jgi:hypothetical protein
MEGKKIGRANDNFLGTGDSFLNQTGIPDSFFLDEQSGN